MTDKIKIFKYIDLVDSDSPDNLWIDETNLGGYSRIIKGQGLRSNEINVDNVDNVATSFTIFKRVNDEYISIYEGTAEIINFFRRDTEIREQMIYLTYINGTFEQNPLPSHLFTIKNNTNKKYILVNNDDEIIDKRTILEPNTTGNFKTVFRISLDDTEYYIIEYDKYCSNEDKNITSERSIKKFTLNSYENSNISYTIEEKSDCDCDCDKSFWEKPGYIVLMIFLSLIVLSFLYMIIRLYVNRNRSFLN